jgi:hypothetical protein
MPSGIQIPTTVTPPHATICNELYKQADGRVTCMLSVKYVCVMNRLEFNLLMKFALLVIQKYYRSGHSCMPEILREYGLGFYGSKRVKHFP